MTIDATLQRIRSCRRDRGWSLNRLASAAGLRESTIRLLDDPDWNPTADTLRKLESAIEDAPTDARAA